MNETHNLVKNAYSYFCTKCGIASGDGEGIYFMEDRETPRPCLPTQPTQEKECCDTPRKTTSVSTLRGRRTICNNCGKDWNFASETKPTQDTESWEETFEKDLDQITHVMCAPRVYKDLLKFIKQKKQEWITEGIMKGQCDPHAQEFLDEARTQGAEAAVKYIEERSALGELYNGIIVRNEVLEEARLVGIYKRKAKKV